MTNKRSPDFDLRQVLRDPGFTPRVTDVPALLDVLAEGGEDTADVERALLRVANVVNKAAIERAASSPSGRTALLRLMGRLYGETPDPEIAGALAQYLGDEDARVRRAAATALGKARPESAEAALVEALHREADASARRAILTALGKVGGEVALAELGALKVEEGEGREVARASIIAAREVARKSPSKVILDRFPKHPLPIALHCRSGLGSILEGELPRSLGAYYAEDPPVGPHLAATLARPPIELFQARTLLSFGILLDPQEAREGDPSEAVIASLVSTQAREILSTFTEGPLRFRLHTQSGGKRRATIWRIAEEVSKRAPELVNDPTESPWEAIVHEGSGLVRIELVPSFSDPRFVYRTGDVPAASHPTIAAALARVGGVESADIVWDPFVGSGLELCERARLGSYRRLIGSDIDPLALEVARKNLDAAGATEALLFRGDACSDLPERIRPTLILSNPPLGRRIQRSQNLAPLLDRFVAHAARILTPHGRLVWMSPFPDRTREIAERSGLRAELLSTVDMGGFSAQLQKFVK